MLDSNRSERLSYVGVITATVLGLCLSGLYSYLLFHSLIEIITVAVAFTLFILTWNTRRYLANSYLRLLGIGYAFIALIDLLHALAYKGMDVFPGYGANLPTQLWLAARYLQAVTLFAAPLFVERRVDNRAIFGGYAAAVSGLVAIVYSGNFPDCYIEGKGLTTFKIGSEYAITVLLLISLCLLYRKRKHFNERVFFLTASSIACTALSEIFFTAYVSVYDFANMVGHFFKLAAFYLIYRAILVTGLKEPFDLIFKDLEQAQDALRKANDTLEDKVRQRTAEFEAANEKLKREITERQQAEETVRDAYEYIQKLISSANVMIIGLDASGRIRMFNDFAEKITGYTIEELTGSDWFEKIVPKDRYGYVWETFRSYQERTGAMPATFENPILTKSGEERFISWQNSAITAPDRTISTISFGMDITERKRAEEALRESEGKLGDAARIAHVGYWERDYVAESITLSDEACQIFGLPLQKCFPKLPEWHTQWMQLIHPEDQPRVAQALTDALAGGPPYHIDYRVVRSDGEVRYIHSYAEMTTDESGKPLHMFGTMIDITERKLAEEEIRDLYNHAPCGYHSLDKDGVFVRINETELEWLGYRHEEVIGKMKFADLLTIEGLRKFEESFPRFKASGVIRDLEFEMVRKDGTHFPVLLSASAVTDPHGNYVMSRSTVYDLTERKRAEQKMRELGAIVESSDDAIIGKTLGGSITSWNRGAERIYGYTETEMVGKSMAILIPEGHEDDLPQILGRIKSGEHIKHYETVRRTKDGRDIPMSLTVSPIRDSEDRIVAVSTIARDITERKRAEEALRESEQRVRRKLDAILSPEADIGALELSDIIDTEKTQKLMDAFYQLTNIGIGVIDLQGRVLVGTGWQDICTKFHRINPESRRLCIESDLELSGNIPVGTFKQYRCKNNIWDIATPIVLGDKHVGNIFLGQFLFDDETPDYEIFRQQAYRFGFNEQEYLAALNRVPRWSRKTVNLAMSFYSAFAEMISNLSYSNIKLASALEERKRAESIMQARLRLLEFANSHSMDELLTETLDEMEALTGSTIGFYHFLESDQRTLLLQNWSSNTLKTMCTAAGKGSHYDVAQAGVWVDCIPERRPVIHNDYASLPHRKGMPEGHAPVVRELIVPILRGTQIRAIIGVGNKAVDYDKSDVGIVSQLGDLSWDIAERKRAEEEIRRLNLELEQRVRDRTAQLEAANQELEAFAYSVSHDLRAPLRHIDGFLDLLRKRTEASLDERSQHYMATISDATRRMGTLIDDLLSFSRMGRCEMSKMQVDLGTLVQDVILEIEPEAGGRAVRWHVADLPVVTGDRAMLRIVLVNLISNALKFTRPREQAEIQIGCTPGRGTEVIIFIRDNGVGFDMHYADKLFGVFQRLHRADEFEGTGIGLANVHRIINRHGGCTWAEGEVDRGATFYFSLPQLMQGA